MIAREITEYVVKQEYLQNHFNEHVETIEIICKYAVSTYLFV